MKNSEQGSSLVSFASSTVQTTRKENRLSRMRAWAVETPCGFFWILKQFVNLDCCRYQISFGYVLIKECLELSRVIAHVSLLDYWNKKPYTGLCGFFRTFSGMAAKTRCRNLAPTHSYFDWHKKLLLLPRKKPLEQLDYIGTSFGITGRGLHYNLKKKRTGYY